MESKQITDHREIGGIHSTAVYALATHSIPDPNPLYEEVHKSAPTSMSAEVDFLNQYINPVYDTVDESNNDSNPVCKGAPQLENTG